MTDLLKQTPSQTVGPFFQFALTTGGENVLTNDLTTGEHIVIRGRILDGDSAPVPDAMIEIWQADSQGIFNHPADLRCAQADPNFRHFGRCNTLNAGQFLFRTVKPGCVPFDSSQMQAPHINVRVFARGMLVHAVTRLYFPDESANHTDPILNSIDLDRRETLIAQRDGTKGESIYRFDIVLQGSNETVFFDA